MAACRAEALNVEFRTRVGYNHSIVFDRSGTRALPQHFLTSALDIVHKRMHPYMHVKVVAGCCICVSQASSSCTAVLHHSPNSQRLHALWFEFDLLNGSQ